MTRARWVAVAWGVAVCLGLAGLVLTIVNEGLSGEGFTPHSFVSVGYASVGALILWRKPHRIGTLFLSFGFYAASTGLLFQVCGAGHDQTAIPSLCSSVDGRLGPALWPATYLFFGCLFLLFPTGRLPSRRWRPLTWIFVGSWAAIVLGNLTAGDVSVEEQAGFLFPVAVWALAAVATAPFFRIRRANPTERQQLRWLGYAIGVALLLIGVGVPLDLAGQQGALSVVNILLLTVVVLGVPAAIAVAILRYRLYDIDVIVNRTLVYAGLTIILALSYLGIVVILQRLLTPVTADSDVAVAGSTLAVAALFRPMRSRMQNFIDHRFYRRKYDATETLQRFTVRLRDQVDLESLKRELLDAVGATMHPSHASVVLMGDRP